MKRLIFLSVMSLLVPSFSLAQQLTMATVFKAMPDSLLPYLTTNDRLDMVDFCEARMKAEVTNQLGGQSEMLFLSTDSLMLRLSSVLTIELKLVPVAESVDSSSCVVRMVRRYTLNENQAVRVVDVYTTAWRHLSTEQESASLLKRDDDLFLKPHL